MKKLLMVITIFALVLVGCDNGSKSDNGNNNNNNNNGNGLTTLKIKNESPFTDITDVIWQSVSFSINQTENSIKAGMYVTKDVQPGSGYIFFKRKTNPINARTQELVVVGKNEQKEFTFTDNTIIVDANNSSRSDTLASLQPEGPITTLKIKNESTVEITDVIWRTVSFANSQTENSIKTLTSVTNNVEAGSGYISFKRKSNPITARTVELVNVNEAGQTEFTFTDNTVITESSYTYNSGKLATLQSVIVFFDDAEGEWKPYYKSTGFASYYANESDLRGNNKVIHHFSSPKNGKKSIAIGGDGNSWPVGDWVAYYSSLNFEVTLKRKAKLSFWYADNKRDGNYTSDFHLTNVTVGFGDTYDLKNNYWTFVEFELEPDTYNLQWQHPDIYDTDSSGNIHYSYLCLDDILIYYTE